MRWHRQRKTETNTPDPEAVKALHKAEDDLRDTQKRNREIVTAVSGVKRVSEVNHVAEMIREAFGGASS